MIEPKKLIKGFHRNPPAFVGRDNSKVVRLDRNERTTPFPSEHLRRILDGITPHDVAAYPQLEPFYGKLAGWLKVDRTQVLLTAGSDTGIRAVFDVYVEEGDEVLIFPPTYGMYPAYCEMSGAVKKEVFYDEDFSLPLDRALDAINPETKLVAIPNPNHTGTIFKDTELIEIIKKARSNDALVLVDEAYYHFCPHTILPHVNDFDNLIVARTFSKACGIASLRIGYLVSNRETIAELYKVKLSHEITGISAKFGEYLIDHPDITADYAGEVREGIEYLSKEFKKLGIFVPPTQANFLYAKLPPPVAPERVVNLLKERDYNISGPFSLIPIRGFIRITAGPAGQMREFFSEFRKIYDREYKGNPRGAAKNRNGE